MVTTNRALDTEVRDIVHRQIDRGEQIGVQVCAYKDGEMIVDICAGAMGPDDPRPVQADTLFSSFSTTKGVAATALHILADRGLIDYDAPVARYWPEFGVHGKDQVTVAQAMSHQAGLHAVPAPLTADFVTDWGKGLAFVANGTPAWEPGTATGYHALTYSWIVGGIVQGATGRHIRDVIAEEIAGPLGMRDEIYVGIPEGVENRLATLKELDGGLAADLPIPPDHDFFKAMPPGVDFSFNDMRIRRSCLPAANGHFSARALAKMYAALAGGGEIDGVRLVSRGRIAEMQRVRTEDVDRVLMLPIPKGVGFMMGGGWGGVTSVFGPRRTAFGHSGAGGSTAFADPEAGLAVAVTINQMQSSLQGEGPTVETCEFIRQRLGVA